MTRAQAQRLSDYLAHIVGAISRIQRYVDGMTEQALMADEKTQDAVIRNRVSHGYFQVDWALIWKTIHQDLPELRQQIERLQRGLPAA